MSNKLGNTQFTLYNQQLKPKKILITDEQVDQLRKAFELFIAEQNKSTLRPSELLQVFLRLGLDSEYQSCTDMLCYLVEECGDVEMSFDKFIGHANDFYSQTTTKEGIERIFKLFDGNMTGEMTREDFERVLDYLEIKLTE